MSMCGEKVDKIISPQKLAEVIRGVNFVNGVEEKRIAA